MTLSFFLSFLSSTHGEQTQADERKIEEEENGKDKDHGVWLPRLLGLNSLRVFFFFAACCASASRGRRCASPTASTTTICFSSDLIGTWLHHHCLTLPK